MVEAEAMGYKITRNKEIENDQLQEEQLDYKNWEEEDKWESTDSEVSEVSEESDSMEAEVNDWEKEMEKLSKVEQLRAILYRLRELKK